MMWYLSIDGIDVSASQVSGVSVSFEAENLCGEIKVDLADRSVLDSLTMPRVPREPIITYRHSTSHPAIFFFLEDIDQPHSPDARPATIWGRSRSARLASPWAQKISRQWAGPTSVNAIVQELAALCGVTVTVTNDFPVCQYCYAVSGQSPAEIIRDLAKRSGQVLWPQMNGSLLIAPRAYRDLSSPEAMLDDRTSRVESVERSGPEFGNRLMISGDAAVAGLSVQVVPMYPDDDCVPADGAATVRLVAVVLGMDGRPVASGTVVDWQASSGRLKEQASQTGVAMITGEVRRADSYRAVTLNLPAASVVGVYDFIDYRRRVNLYDLRGGSVQGRVITF
ncbi:MAG: Ig-like domain-containing protein, partial [Coriobacteriia bacterium]|nr:Ig-like domain-containing protein [Coriobacteriia bacterium]